jgi:acyl-CoA reductase-like NAD-dependent aldehyde dehydrogenase
MLPGKFLIENKLEESNKSKPVINPYTNETVAEVFVPDEKHLDRSINYLLGVFEKYKKIPAYTKSELLYKVSNKISERKERLAVLITTETGKPVKFSRVEIDRAVLTFRLGAQEAIKIHGEVLPLDLLSGSENKVGIVRRFPLGLILGITPWNFPVNLVGHKVSPALASSNVIMIKPSSNSPLCGIEIGKIILEACEELGLDFSPINVLPIGGSEMDKHVTDDRINMISFTGSSDIGWKLKTKSAKQRVSLELGGNAGVILDEDTELKTAVQKLLIGGFSAAGQSCISVQRIYVHEKIFGDFKALFVEEAKKVKFGNPFEDDTIVGPMITEQEAIRAEKWINEAKREGAEILIGGGRNAAMLEPTIIENAPNHINVKCSEVFAPVTTIESFKTFEEAVKEINNSRFGLQAGVFSNNLKNVLYAYNNIQAGGVIINDVSAYRMDSMPYGGTLIHSAHIAVSAARRHHRSRFFFLRFLANYCFGCQ